MSRSFLVGISVVLSVTLGLVTTSWAVPITIGNNPAYTSRTYDSSAFADSTSIGYENASGWNLGNGVQYDGGNNTFVNFDVFFTDNIITNGIGNDFSFFEGGGFEQFDVTIEIGGVTRTYSNATINNFHDTDLSDGFGVGGTNFGQINLLDVDLSSFGVAANGSISSMSIRLTDWGIWGSADIMAIGGIHSAAVPEPTSILLLGGGLTGVVFFRRKQKLITS